MSKLYWYHRALPILRKNSIRRKPKRELLNTSKSGCDCQNVEKKLNAECGMGGGKKTILFRCQRERWRFFAWLLGSWQRGKRTTLFPRAAELHGLFIYRQVFYWYIHLYKESRIRLMSTHGTALLCIWSTHTRNIYSAQSCVACSNRLLPRTAAVCHFSFRVARLSFSTHFLFSSSFSFSSFSYNLTSRKRSRVCVRERERGE
jgi:hypothetical protein